MKIRILTIITMLLISTVCFADTQYHGGTGVEYTQAEKSALAVAPTISSGDGAPSSTPTKVGDIYIDTTNDVSYTAVGTASSADWLQGGGGSADVASEIHSATEKTPIVDADEIGFYDSVSSAIRKITWQNLKGTLKTYFDTLYAPKYCYYVDASESDQGATASLGSDTIYDIVTAASGSKITIILYDSDEDGETVYTFDTDYTIPSTVDLKIENGAVVAGNTEDETITTNGSIEVGKYQWIDSTITLDGSPKIDYAYPEWWGENATPGTTDMIEELTAGSTFVAGTPITLKLHGAYLTSSAWSITQDNVKIKGDDPATTYLTKTVTHRYITVGDVSSNLTTTEGNTLASDADYGDMTITLSSGKGANITAGTWCVIVDDSNGPGATTNTKAEFIHIRDVSTDTLSLSGPLKFDYTTADNAEVYNVDFVEGFSIDGVGFDGNNFVEGANPNYDNVIQLAWCYKPTLRNLDAWELPNVFIMLSGCLQAQLSNIRGRDFLSDAIFGETSNYGYAICEIGLNEGLVASDLTFERVRHGYTTATYNLLIGVPMGSRITNGVSIACRGAGWDTHPEGVDITFVNCVTLGSAYVGLQARSVRTKFVGCTARDTIAHGLYIPSTATGTEVSDLTLSQTNLGTYSTVDYTAEAAIKDDGEYSVIKNSTIELPGGAGIEVTANADYGRYIDIFIKNPAALNGAGMPRGFIVADSGPTELYAKNIMVRDYGSGNLYSGFYLTSITLTNAVFEDCSSLGHSNAAFETNQAGVFFRGGNGVNSRNIGQRVTETISGGVLTVTNSLNANIKVNGESDSADDLVTITGGIDGSIITLTRYSSGANITIKHGTGNISIEGETDFVLDHTLENITLQKVISTWMQVGRNEF